MSFIEPAFAQAAQGTTGGFDIMSFIPILLVVVVFYFFLIRPQQKKVQQQKDLLSSLKRGDKVITSGGIIGEITKIVNDQEIQVEIAEGVKVRVVRAMVADVLSAQAAALSSSTTEEKSKVKKAAGRSKKTA